MIASILYVDGTLRQVELDKAIKAYQALTGVVEPTEAQADWLCTIKRIFLPPSAQPPGYESATKQGKDEVYSHLTHIGRLQGRSEQMPLGDR